MKMPRIATLFLFVLLSAATAGVSAQALLSNPQRGPTEQDQALAQILDENDLRRRAVEAERASDWSMLAAVMRRLSAIRPNNPDYRYELAAAYARANDKSGGYDALLSLQRVGMAYDLAADERLANLHGTEVWTYLVDLNKKAAEPFGEGKVAFELPAEDRLLESIAYDARQDSFLFGSARDGVIYRRGKDGKVTPWAQPQGDHWWAIMNMVVDPRGRHLWATSAAIPHFSGFQPQHSGQSALLKINLADGKLLAAYPAPKDGFAHLFNGLAVSSTGQVVIAEGLRGQIFQLDNEAIEPLMAERSLNALRGLAFSADGKVLYFADYERGLFGLDLVKRTAFDLIGNNQGFFSGIDGLFAYEGQLVIIQTGLSPQRVVRLKLTDDGRGIQLAVPLDAAHTEFATPSAGVLKGNELHFIANTQRDYYDGFGLRKGDRELPPVKVFRTDVRFNWDYETPSLPQAAGR